VWEEAAGWGVPLLGVLPFDEEVEAATGDPARLLETRVGAAVRELVRSL
jgi:hypothetical protein